MLEDFFTSFNDIPFLPLSLLLIKAQYSIEWHYSEMKLSRSLELGHDSGECPDGINIMASGTVAKGTALEWSKCSSAALTTKLRYVFNHMKQTH